MDASHLTTLLSRAPGMSALAIAAVALTGLLVGVAPSSLPLYSVVGGYVGGQVSGRAKGVWLSAGFVLGQATADAALGLLFGFLGQAVVTTLARYLALTNLLLAALLVVSGLALWRKIRIAVPLLRPKASRVDTFGAAYALGVPFGFTTCPACTPLMLPVLGAAAATGSPWLGAILLFVFGLARGAPLLLVGAAAQIVTRMPRLTPWVGTIERAGGVALILAGLFFLYQSAAFAGLAPPLQAMAAP